MNTQGQKVAKVTNADKALMKSHWLCCEKCGKRLLKRRENGLFEFMFGSSRETVTPEGNKMMPPVHIVVAGSVEIRCLRASCGHRNRFNFFPTQMD